MHLYWTVACLSNCVALAGASYGYHGQWYSKQARNRWNMAVSYQVLGLGPLLLLDPAKAHSSLAVGLLSGGTALFCGPLYYDALTDKSTFNCVMPLGGVMLLGGWLTLGLLYGRS